jgi:hypothetical protein
MTERNTTAIETTRYIYDHVHGRKRTPWSVWLCESHATERFIARLPRWDEPAKAACDEACIHHLRRTIDSTEHVPCAVCVQEERLPDERRNMNRYGTDLHVMVLRRDGWVTPSHMPPLPAVPTCGRSGRVTVLGDARCE